MGDRDAAPSPPAGTGVATRFIGKLWRFGPHIDTDMIMPGKYLAILDPKELAKHVLEGADPEFPAQVRPGDIVVAGENFGCGSSREHAPVALKAAGIPVVVAESFARIFFRNSINLGFPLLEVKGIAAACQTGHELEVDLETGHLRNRTTGATFTAKPLPPNVLQIMRVGGLVNKVRIARGLPPIDPSAPRKLAAGKSD